MRKVIFGINMSLDGCCDHTKFEPDEELMEYWTRIMKEAGTLAYGRKTYQLMVPFWPDMARGQSAPTKDMNDFAQAFAAVPEIVVFSRTLEKVDQSKVRLVRTSPLEEIVMMKQGTGGDIILGGVDLPSQLMKQNLVDEYRIVVTPVLVGAGPYLMEGSGLPEGLKLKFAGSRAFKSGCIELRYLKQ